MCGGFVRRIDGSLEASCSDAGLANDLKTRCSLITGWGSFASLVDAGEGVKTLGGRSPGLPANLGRCSGGVTVPHSGLQLSVSPA